MNIFRAGSTTNIVGVLDEGLTHVHGPGRRPKRADATIWRYVSFSRFTWLLQTQLLWFCRADLLGDPWEGTVTEDQLDLLIKRHPIHPVDDPSPSESAIERTTRIVNSVRQSTFVSCWSESPHESHALWRIYCPPSESVAIRTAFSRLHVLAEMGLPPIQARVFVDRVSYDPPRGTHTPDPQRFVLTKRPMFAYEREVRAVLWHTHGGEERLRGQPLPWDVERSLQAIRVHPEADRNFLETVKGVVAQWAPSLADVVSYSDMSLKPPIKLLPPDPDLL